MLSPLVGTDQYEGGSRLDGGLRKGRRKRVSANSSIDAVAAQKCRRSKRCSSPLTSPSTDIRFLLMSNMSISQRLRHFACHATVIFEPVQSACWRCQMNDTASAPACFSLGDWAAILRKPPLWVKSGRFKFAGIRPDFLQEQTYP